MRALLAVLVAVPLLAGCGGGGGPVTLHWYVGQETSGAYRVAAESCTEAAGGRYRIELEPLPRTSTAQREQLVRRLAARDRTVDLVGLDVVWTAEFAQAGWLRPWIGADAAAVTTGVLAGPLATARYQAQWWAAPFTTNTQLLWYRKSLVAEPPATWDELVDDAELLPAGRNEIAVQGGRYEGFTTWVTALLASAGTGLVADADDPAAARAGLADAPARAALAVLRRVARSPAADPGLTVADEADSRELMLSGRAAFSVNYTTLYAAAGDSDPALRADLGWARYPRVLAGRPSRPPLGGVNLGVGAYSPHPAEAFEAARCLRSTANQRIAAVRGGLPPTLGALYDDPVVAATFPFGALLRESLGAAAPRPATPAWSDVSLAVQEVLHPPASVTPDRVPELRRRIDAALSSRGLF